MSVRMKSSINTKIFETTGEGTDSLRSREKLLERTLEPVFSNGTGQAAM